jgi:hypothetical protein
VKKTLAEKAGIVIAIVLVGVFVFSSLPSLIPNQRWTAVSAISMPRADSTQSDLNQVLDDAMNYLYANYVGYVGFIRESPDSQFYNNYWAYSDNYLASLVLRDYGDALMADDITNRIELYLSQAGICNPMSQYMALRESVFHFDNPQSVILARFGGATVMTTMNNVIGDPLLPWNYSDVAFLQAVYFKNLGNESGAMESYIYGMNRSDEKGFTDDAYKSDHRYQTYKLALYIYASKLLGQEDYNRTFFDKALVTLGTMQQSSPGLSYGGFSTWYDSDLVARGGVNTETTSLAVLALNLTTPQEPIPEFGGMPFVVLVFLTAVVSTVVARRRKAQ